MESSLGNELVTVDEHQVVVVQLHRPTARGLGDAIAADVNRNADAVAEVLDDDAMGFLVGAREDPNPGSNRHFGFFAFTHGHSPVCDVPLNIHILEQTAGPRGDSADIDLMVIRRHTGTTAMPRW
ncbi:MAG: hypothetical protein QOI01_6167 [Mycobacterium sp.]|jgi:hypothetical protein|nr:hypothetical protein [Mycobacterium sp.]